MSGELSGADTETVHDVIEHTRLSRIDVHELSARRSEPPSDDVETEGRLAIRVDQRIGASGFGVRLNVDALFPEGEASAAVAAEYELLDGAAFSSRALQLFTNEVAVMTIYPYLREAVATITGKVLGVPAHLPLIQRGDIKVAVDEQTNSE